MIDELRTFLESFQDSEGKFVSGNYVKSTSEFLLVHRLCPHIGVGDAGRARTYLVENMPCFAFLEVTQGFKQMERIWQIAVGIPEDTLFLSGKFLELCFSGVSASVKSALLLVLFLQNVDAETSLDTVLKEVMNYQENLLKTVSLDSLYETTHNLLTFYIAYQKYDVDDIIFRCCKWLSQAVFSYENCIDILAETVSVTHLCGYEDGNSRKIISLLMKTQNTDGGLPIFAGEKSEFHPSLVGLWGLTASGFM